MEGGLHVQGTLVQGLQAECEQPEEGGGMTAVDCVDLCPT